MIRGDYGFIDVAGISLVKAIVMAVFFAAAYYAVMRHERKKERAEGREGNAESLPIVDVVFFLAVVASVIYVSLMFYMGSR